MKVAVLVAAGGASWEPSALGVIESAGPRVRLLKRCMDLSDLLATAATGSASAAVIGASVVGFDLEVVSTLRGQGVAVVAVRDGGPLHDELLTRLGVDHQVDPAELDGLPGVLAQTVVHEVAHELVDPPIEPAAEQAGQLVAVWGPTGAPGRTTLATALAAELARIGHESLLIDADPYGGAVAQHLGMPTRCPDCSPRHGWRTRGGSTPVRSRRPPAASAIDFEC
jgi:hypothetical protein